MRIIVVHGRGTKPSYLCKLRYVREVLTESVRRVDRKAGRWLTQHPQTIQLAYYADLFRRLLGESPDQCASFRKPIDRLYEDSHACPTWLAFRGLMQDVGVDAAVLLARFLKRSVREQVVARQFSDVLPYFRNRAFASRVRMRLQRLFVPALRRQEHILLIAHSFGSVVAFDVLWKLSHMSEYHTVWGRKIECFVTMGSPLGDETVRAHLLGWRDAPPRRYPTNIKCWCNLSARGDVICHDARLANDFRPMVKLGYVERFEEHTGLCNVYRSREGVWSPHKLYGYLILPQVGHLVARHLR